ncbi:MAG TPA: hypothetical protein ENG32_01920 [bacterium]|nr:hypothetical protein [bacterium]
MAKIRVQIIIRGKIVKVLEGEEAEKAAKAIRLILKDVKNKRSTLILKPKITFVDISEENLPEEFSYSQAVLEALEKGLKDPYSIAEYVFQRKKEFLEHSQEPRE